MGLSGGITGVVILKVERIENLNFEEVKKVLSSQKLTDTQKIQFIKTNHTQIQKIVESRMSSKEYQILLKARPLQKFRPIKNSFTKKGDKILLASALGIEPNEVDDYINNVTDTMESVDNLNFLPLEKMESVKTYVYRHGSKDQLVNFLDYELKTSTDKIKTLYKTLEYHTGGVADYFIRPIHRMDNKTLVKIYNVIDKNLKESEKAGYISSADNLKISEWALFQIYKLQNNSKFINAVKTYKVLSQ